MPETTPLIKAALNLMVGAGFDVYGICFVFRKWEPLPPFTKMPYDAICIIRHFISFISQGIVLFILLSFPMHKALQCAKVIPGC